MSEDNPTEAGWFSGVEPGDIEAGVTAIQEGSASTVEDWPARAVESGFAADESEYYERLHETTVAASRQAVSQREGADDQQLIHSIRTLDDCQRLANELTERVAEWAGSRDPEATVDSEYIEELADRESTDPIDERLVSLAGRIVGLQTEVQEIRTLVEQTAESVAPNLTAMAGPELTARLIALAGGLEELAKKPAGTIQVLGAEDALFAHLRGGAPSPKHGVIFTHEYVRGTAPVDRGSAARALSGKLAIAARIDYYSGEYRPEIEAELDERIERIRARDAS
ncbi:NOP5/NOP56 family protein [Halobacteriaceae archaeon SHR40]|uniref:NOP5/NOP56 family protein n=1 Tax=Halovenus amylolytica TaxID=2500550 RepID=UPI000FE2B55B